MDPSPLPDPSFEPEGLRRLARGLLGDPERAEDAVQEAWVVALEKDRRGPSRWWRGVVARRAMHRRRTDARRGKYERGAAAAPETGDVVSHVEALDEQRRALAALRALDEPYRRILWLHFFGGHAPAQIAAMLEVPPATVRTHLHRGLARLRETLAERDRGQDGWKRRLAAFLALPELEAPAVRPQRAAWTGVAVATGIGAAVIGGVLWASGREAPPRSPETVAAPTRAGTSLASRPAAIPVAEPALPGALTVRGRVEAPGGASPAGAWAYAVRKVRPRGDASDPTASVRLGEDGTFALALREPGAHWIVVTPPAGTPWRREVLDGAVAVASPSLRVAFGEAVALRGQIRDERGDPVRGALVEVLPVDAGAVRAWPGPDDPLLGAGVPVEASDGAFRAMLADDLPRRVRVRAWGHADAESIVQRTSDAVHVVLAPSAAIRVEVEGVEPRDVIARLERLPTGDAPAYRLPAPTRYDRVLAFENGIAAGSYRLELTSPGVRPHRIDVRVRAGEPIVTMRVALRPLGAPASLRMRGVELRGAPPTQLTRPGAVILMRDPETDGGAWRIVVPEVLPDGTLRATGLLDGATPLLAVDRDGTILVARRELELAPGLETEVVAAVVPGVRVRMPDAVGAGAASLHVVGGDVEWPVYRWGGAVAETFEGERVPAAGTVLGPYPAGGAPLRLRVRGLDGTVAEHGLEAEAPAGAVEDGR